MGKKILDVGQCGVDGPRMGRFLVREFEAEVDRAHSLKEAERMVGEGAYDLVLVNRVLDRDGARGLDVIAALLKERPGLKVMLVSDYAEAQEEAVGLGALRGFGKAKMESEETEEVLREVLAE